MSQRGRNNGYRGVAAGLAMALASMIVADARAAIMSAPAAEASGPVISASKAIRRTPSPNQPTRFSIVDDGAISSRATALPVIDPVLDTVMYRDWLNDPRALRGVSGGTVGDLLSAYVNVVDRPRQRQRRANPGGQRYVGSANPGLVDSILNTRIEPELVNVVTDTLQPNMESGGFISFSFFGLGRFLVLSDSENVQMVEMTTGNSIDMRPVSHGNRRDSSRLTQPSPGHAQAAIGATRDSGFSLLSFLALVLTILFDPLSFIAYAVAITLWIFWHVTRLLR